MTAAIAPLAPIFSPALHAPAPAPAGLADWQKQAIERCAESAILRGLRLLARSIGESSICRGQPVFIVSSASSANGVHLVWIDGKRIHCDCAGRTKGHAFTCSHAQFVRLLIVAEHARPASAPTAIIEPTPAAPAATVAPEDDPDPTPPPAPADPHGPRCPTCGGAADADEIAELDECLQCLQMSADRAREDRAHAEWEADEAARIAAEMAEQLPCWACGAPATAETDHGLYCDACVTKPAAQQRREAGARQKRLAKEETARRVIAREKAREKAGTHSEASPRHPTEAARRAAEKAAKRRPAAEPDTRETRFARAMQSIAIMRGES